MSWFLRGAQSAVFYYASCTPWHKYKHQRRRKQQNRLDRAARDAYEKELKEADPYGFAQHNPEMLYRQPSPQATNEFWADEIRMGPGPPPNRAKKLKLPKDAVDSKNDLALELARPPDIVVDDEKVSAETGDSTEKEADALDKTASTVHVTPGSRDGTTTTKNLSRKSSTRVSAEDPKWNHARFYQREDEELWGVVGSSGNPTVSDVNLNRTRSSTNRDMPTGVSRPPSAKSRPHAPSTASTASVTTTRSQFSAHLNVRTISQATASTDSIYAAPRAPPLNDNHPPVANNPLHSKKVLTKWMLQPTPAPSVMSGKKQVHRPSSASAESQPPPSRSGSGKSAHRLERPERAVIAGEVDGGSMRRQLSARLLADKMRDGNRSTEVTLPAHGTAAAAAAAEEEHDADVEEDSD